MQTLQLPPASRLEMWPYTVDDEQLWSLDYAAEISEAISGKDDTEVTDWHEINGWLFDLCEAYYAIATCTEREDASDILRKLDAMRFRMSPLFRDQDDLEDTAREAFDVLAAQR